MPVAMRPAPAIQMNAPENFEQKSYARHADHYLKYGSGGLDESLAKTWFTEGTVDAWRHQRHYDLLGPVLGADPGACWLTVGDGRYGKDAHYLAQHGCSALATDISDVLLREAKRMGFIQDFKRENAEALSFGDGEFDWVLCKESYHHFPRPMRALYEMLRVAGKGVVLIEPNDYWITENPFAILPRKLKAVFSRLRGRDTGRHAYEESGNFVFTLSRREVEKVALGLNYRAVAFKGLNDCYIKGVENERLADRGPLQRKVRRHIALRDILCGLGLLDYIILAAVILKEEPTAGLRSALATGGFKIVVLPRNPYLT